MKNLKSFVWASAVVLGLVACENPTATTEYDVIPMPQEVAVMESAVPFVLTASTPIHVYNAAGVTTDGSNGGEEMMRNAQFLAEYIEAQLGYKLEVKADNAEGVTRQSRERSDNVYEGIVLKLKDDAEQDMLDKVARGDERAEGYTITVTSERVLVEAESTAGIFYGLQTLRKALPAEKGAVVALPAAVINDAPRFAYRGAHFDVVRHFFPVDSVKAFIDMMTLHNMNHLHWHITDDQGWRIETKKYPRLTEVGGTRCGTMVGKDFESCDSVPYGGFYTQEEAREIVRYAAERYITVIPEVDMPGHMVAALTAYPELGCTGGPYEVMTKWGISDDLLCAGNDAVYQFVDDVLDEIMDIFPSKDIHIGGDECPKVRWEKCPKCQTRIKALGIKGDSQYTAEQKLQSHFTHHVDEYLAAHGRTCIGWDEILEGGVSDNATVMSWRGEAGGIEAARLGHRVIMVPAKRYYFDYYQTVHRDTEPLCIGSYISTKQVYEYNPVPAELTEEEQQYIWGTQANLWTEYIPTFSKALYMYLPRAAALAENQWSPQECKDWQRFKDVRLPRLLKLYETYGYNYSRRMYEDSDEDADATMPW